MLHISPIEHDQASPELRASLNEVGASFSELPNFLRVLANAPSALKAYVLADAALVKGRVTPRERELIALLVAEINGCSYSLLGHYDLARRIGLSVEEIRLARQAAARNPRVQAMLQFVEGVVLQRGDINEEDLCTLRQAGFADAQIIEIVAHIALNIFTNYLNTVARTEVESPQVKPCGEPLSTKTRPREIAECIARPGHSLTPRERTSEGEAFGSATQSNLKEVKR